MMAGSIFRWRTKEKEYKNHKKSNRSESCDFCQLVKQHTSQVVEETQHCLIIKNRFGYDLGRLRRGRPFDGDTETARGFIGEFEGRGKD